jgi:capsular exopolysaccharide synthesis family protein
MLFKRRSKKKKPRQRPPLLLENFPMKSNFGESYNSLRANVNFSFMEKEFRSLLITSAGQSEGKTITVANLAYVISQAGKSVLMMDCDLRNPMLSRTIFHNKSPGLTGLISDVFRTDVGSGSLDRFGPGDLIRLLYFQKKTGCLRLSNPKEKVDLFFLQGRIKGLKWLTKPEDKKLGNTLLKSGALTRDQVKLAMAQQKDTGQKLAFTLINMGFMGESDLKGPLVNQMMEGLRVALQIKTGTFEFKTQLESDFEMSTFDPVDFDQLYRQVLVGGEELPFLRKNINQCIVDTGTANLSFLPSGVLPHSPTELLESERMTFLISDLKRRFDVLIIDSPPILPASDALLLAPKIDGTILIVKADTVNRELVRSAVEKLQVARANLIGAVLNQVDVTKDGYYGYYHRYYSRYYGENT